jgi:hypothetical protein
METILIKVYIFHKNPSYDSNKSTVSHNMHISHTGLHHVFTSLMSAVHRKFHDHLPAKINDTDTSPDT